MTQDVKLVALDLLISNRLTFHVIFYHAYGFFFNRTSIEFYYFFNRTYSILKELNLLKF